MVDRIKIQIKRYNAVIGIFLVFLGIAAPLIINIENFKILPLLESSILDTDSGKLILAAFKLVILNSLRALPHYLGAFIIAESIIITLDGSITYWLRGFVALIIIPSVYKIIFWIYNISYDFGAPAFIAVFSIILIEYLNFSNISLLKKSLIVILLLLGVQWMDIIPVLSPYGFGRGEISSEIKIIADFIESEQVLTVASITFFIVFISIAFLISKLLNDEEKLIATMERNKEIEKGLGEARLKALEARTTQEIQSLVHDLKTPLTSVQALASVSQMIAEDEKIKLYMEKVVESVDNLNRMISQILYESSKANIKTEELFEHVFSQLASHKNKDSIAYYNGCMNKYIYINEIRFSRAIINIINNAFDAIDNNGSIKILAIDDSKDILFAISAICEYENWEAYTASHAIEGVNLFKDKGANLILVDYHMPKIDGIKAVKMLRNINKSVPIIVLTIEERSEIADKFMAAGADDFALKPIKALDLIWRIKAHLRMNQEPNATENTEVEFRKGISRETLNIVLDCLNRNGEYTTIKKISQETGLAYQTVHRYLQYLIENKKVEVTLNYGKQGRPKNRYIVKT
ncbi:MAG: response regulator [Lutispora sp.]|nr:response regulator [Lutispora sp.]